MKLQEQAHIAQKKKSESFLFGFVVMSAELKTDPRTGLEIIDIPVTHDKYFSDLRGTLMHWFGDVEKFNRMWRVQNRVCIITDVCIYFCRMDGFITRCVHIQAIQEAITADTAIGLRVGPPDYDMLVKFSSVADRESVMFIISKIYWCVNGRNLPTRNLNAESGEAMQQILNLTKPNNFVNRIEPLRTVKALTRMMVEKQKREEEDRQVVEQEFERIKEGLALELQKYRSEEYDKMSQQLSSYMKLLNEKENTIEYLRATSVSMDDPDVWKKCPNCSQFRKMLESHPNEDKQKIFRLRREIESQRHILEHLQAAIQHRSRGVGNDGAGGGGGGGGDPSGLSQQYAAMKAELAQAVRKNRELQQLILESPLLTSDVKQRVARLMIDSSDHGAEASERVLVNGRDAVEILHEKDREIRHLKTTLQDMTSRHLRELEACRVQIQQYDEQVVAYVTKLQQEQQQQPSYLSSSTNPAPAIAASSSSYPNRQGGANGATTPSSYYESSTAAAPPFSSSSPQRPMSLVRSDASQYGGATMHSPSSDVHSFASGGGGGGRMGGGYQSPVTPRQSQRNQAATVGSTLSPFSTGGATYQSPAVFERQQQQQQQAASPPYRSGGSSSGWGQQGESGLAASPPRGGNPINPIQQWSWKS